jgi:hypothetical protein
MNQAAIDVLVKHADAMAVVNAYRKELHKNEMSILADETLTPEQIKAREKINARISEKLLEAQEEVKGTRENRLAEFHDRKVEEPQEGMRGLGDLVAKTIKATTGIEGCGGCKKRQAALNKWVPFHKREGKK